MSDDRHSLITEQRGTPKAIMLSIAKYVDLAFPKPDVLRIIGEESVRDGTDKLTDDEIDTLIQEARAKKKL